MKMRLLVYQVHPSLTDLIIPEMNGRALAGHQALENRQRDTHSICQGACQKNSHCVKSEGLSSRLKPRRVTCISQLILR